MRRELTVIARKRIECGVASPLIISFFKLFSVMFDKISVQPGEIFPTKLRDLALLPFHSDATIVESSAYNNRGFNSHCTDGEYTN